MAYIAGTHAPAQFDVRLASSLPQRYQTQEQISSQYPSNQITLPFESLSDDQASRIVRHDYDNAANYRYQNHDWRWVIADTLYTGWKPTRYWEGTKIPMASLAIMVTFDQIESFVPRVIEELFEDPDWFGTDPLQGTHPIAARQVRDIILSQLHYSSPQWQLREVIKSAAMYGNGVLTACWEYSINKVLQCVPEFEPVTRTLVHPITRQRFQVPTGKYRRIIRDRTVTKEINRPVIRYVPLRYCYPDPNCPTPVCNDGRFFIHTSYMTVDELLSLYKSDKNRFASMPDKYTLLMMAHQKPMEQSDTTLAEMEASRRGSYTPIVDQSTDPAAARLKMVHYYSKDRIIWSINGKYLCYNQPNSIKRITYYNCIYADLLDRWNAMGVCDVLEAEQRVQEGLVNARLNELALSLHPTTVRNRGNSTPVYQLRVRPGAISDSNDPKNDAIRQYPQNHTQGAFLEVQASDLRAQKRTGITDIAMLGVGTSTNPAARTATGAGLQGQASHTRIRGFIGLVELLVIAPMLDDVLELNNLYLDPNQMIESVQGTKLDPLAIWGGKVKFVMRAAARMQSKQALLQLLPPILQFMMNPLLIEQLREQGQTVDLMELMNVIMDATGYKKKLDWIRALTPQEQQMQQQKMMMSPEIIKSQMQDRRMAALKDMSITKEEMTTFRSVLEKMSESHLGNLSIGAGSNGSEGAPTDFSADAGGNSLDNLIAMLQGQGV